MSSQKPAGYTRFQIGLHWIIALLFAVQFLFHEAMESAWEAVEKGAAISAASTAAMAHVAVGILVLVLSIWRISVKVRRGSPELPADEPEWQKKAAHAAHGILYLLMLLIPLSGMAAWFGGVNISAEVHGLLTGLFIAVFVVHFGGALYHRIILKSGVMERMLKANDG